MGVVALSVAVFAAGLAVLIAGVRGRRIDAHPVCRRCLFDLVGVYPARATCPECGATLSDRAIRVGQRRRRTRLIVAGVALAVMGAAGGGTLAWARAASFNWNSVKPAWWLLAELNESRPSPASDAAMTELAARATDGRLGDAAVQQLAERALSAQADIAKSWAAPWGDLVEAARLRGLLSDEDWAAYIRNGQSPRLLLRQRAAANTPTSIGFETTGARLGSNSMFRTRVTLLELDCEPAAGGQLLPEGQVSLAVGTMSWEMIVRGQGTSLMTSLFRPPAEPGMYKIRLRTRVTVRTSYDEAEPPVAEWDHQSEQVLEVLTALDRAVALRPDPTLQEAVAKSLRAREVMLSAKPGGGQMAGISLYIAEPPLPVAFDVYAIFPSVKEPVRLGAVAGPAGTWMGVGVMGDWPEGAEAETVNLLFRASREAAHRTTYLDEIWDGEVLIQGVLVRPGGE